jgi:hypothetical protein
MTDAGGGGDRVRTRDPQLAKLVLYQLSYAPDGHAMVADSSDVRSNSAPAPTRSDRIVPIERWWTRVDSNHLPRAYQARALTN